MMADDRKHPEAQDETELDDLDVSDEASRDVRGGMTKQEFVDRLASKADSTKSP